MAHYDTDIHCSVCRKYCHSEMPGQRTNSSETYVCAECKGKEQKSVKKGGQKTAFEEAQEKLRPLRDFLIADEEESRKKEQERTGFNPAQLLEQYRDISRLITQAREVSKRLSKPPQDLQELILCAVAIEPLASAGMIKIAECFGFKNPTDVKITMLNLVSEGKAKLNDHWQVYV